MQLRSTLILCLLFAISPVQAKDQPPSDESLREMFAISEVRQTMDGAMAQIDVAMQQSMKQALGKETLSAKQEEMLGDMHAEIMQLVSAEMRWEKMEPMFLEIYRKSLTQKEVNGLIKFYKSKAGKAYIAKMPLIMQNTMQLMQEFMGRLMPGMQQIQRDALARIQESPEKS